MRSSISGGRDDIVVLTETVRRRVCTQRTQPDSTSVTRASQDKFIRFLAVPNPTRDHLPKDSKLNRPGAPKGYERELSCLSVNDLRNETRYPVRISVHEPNLALSSTLSPVLRISTRTILISRKVRIYAFNTAYRLKVRDTTSPSKLPSQPPSP